MKYAFEVQSLAETEAWGRALGQLLFPGALVALVGPLGAGKTHLVRAIAVGLEIEDPRVVNSPTFVLIQEYDARLPIFHFDAYRLKNELEFFELGVQEYFQANGVCLVEWADRVQGCLPAERLEVRLMPLGETSRRVEMEAVGGRYEKLLQMLGSHFFLPNQIRPLPNLSSPG